MATEFTQDAVLYFLQSHGGKVRNAELLAHFTAFLRDHDDQARHRELFKQFVNSVATVRQEDGGVRYVALRKKFRGTTTTTGVVSSSEPSKKQQHHPSDHHQTQQQTAAGRRGRSPRDVNRNPAERPPSSRHGRRGEKPPPARETTTTGTGVYHHHHHHHLTETKGEKIILPSAGIIVNNNNNAGETNLNLGISPLHPSYPHDSSTEDAPPQQQQVPLISSTEQLVKPTSPPGNNNNNSHGFDKAEHITIGLLDQSARDKSAADIGAKLGGQIDTQRDQASCPSPPPPHLPPTKAGEKHGETPQQNTERRREACLKFIEAERQQTAGVPLHPHSDQLQITPTRRARHRQSYKTAVSYDDDDEEEKEEEELEIPRRPCSEAVGRGAWPLNVPLEHMNRAISSSSPCISNSPAPSSSMDSASSLTSGFVSLTASGLSSERNASTLGSQLHDIPAIRIEGSGGEWVSSQTTGSGQVAVSGMQLASAPLDSNPPRRSLPLEAENYMRSSLDRAHCIGPHSQSHLSAHLHHPSSQCDPAKQTQVGPNPEQRLNPGARPGTVLDPDPGTSGPRGLGPGERLSSSSSHSSPVVVSPAEYPTSDWPQSGSARAGASEWSNSDESLNIDEGEAAAGTKVQPVQKRAEETRLLSLMHRSERKITAPWHHSTGHLLDNEDAPASVASWQHSTGHLHDSQEESSEGSTSSLTVRKRPAVARRVSSKLRSRMCRSLGAGLDDSLSGPDEEERRGRKGAKTSRQDRLTLISSSLSMSHHFSNSSLSSCSTPPRSRCHSSMDLVEAEEEEGGCLGTVAGGKEGLPATTITITTTTTSPNSTAHDASDFNRESSVPLDRKEHDWLVKGAAGSWTDIYALFREEPSLLNKRDFISGYTVLHWIAKHGDHRVLNTLWYGVSKAGLTLDVDARSACGYTPLHLAAIHGHKAMMRLLVQKFNASVELRDTSGKRPWQYLEQPRPIDMLQLLSAPEWACERERRGRRSGGGRRSDGGGSGGEGHHPSRRWEMDHRNRVAGVSSPAAARVKRSSSIAAFLKHKSLLLFPGHQSDTDV